jgi:MFS family permease
MRLPQLLRSLAHRNFRLYFLGQAISLIGTWMQQVALSWLVYELSDHSAWWLGMVGFATQVPSFLVGPFAGVVIDHYPRHRILLATQSLAMAQAFVIAALAQSGAVQIWHVMALGVFLGLVNAVDMPARQAFLTELVTDRADLSNAIALNSSVFNGARLVGPALAGLVLAETGTAVCFTINGISYLAVLAALLAMSVTPRPPRPHEPFVERLREGVVYAFGFPPIRALILLLAVVSLVGIPYAVLLPVFATEVLKGGAAVFGFLSAAAGVGALAGALFLASRKSVLGLGRWVAAGPGVFGLALIAFSFSRSLPLSLLLMLVAGFALMMHMASSNTILQTIVDEDKRGRVMSLYIMAFMGMSPLGSLLAGGVADLAGAPMAVALGGACCVGASAVFALRLPRLREKIRPIYASMGILPEVATGLQAATALTSPPEQR